MLFRSDTRQISLSEIRRRVSRHKNLCGPVPAANSLTWPVVFAECAASAAGPAAGQIQHADRQPVSQQSIHVVFAEEDTLFRLMEVALRRAPTLEGEKALHYFFGEDIAAPLADLTSMAERLGLPHTIKVTVCRDDAALDRALPGAEFVVLEATTLDTARVEACAGKVRLIQQFGRLTGNIDLATAKRLGLQVANLTRLSTLSCVDHITALILGVARELLPAHRSVIVRRDPALTPVFVADPPCNKFNWAGIRGFRVLAQSTVGLIGLGEISGLVASRLRAMDAHVLYHKRNALSAEEERSYGGIAYAQLDELLAQADFVSLHLPYSRATEKFAGRDFLSKMKRGAFLINAARGGLVDEQALYDNLTNGHLAGAALDVYRYEPMPPDCPLLALDNVLWTPHIAGGEPDYMIVETEAVLSNIAKVARGEVPDNLVTAAA